MVKSQIWVQAHLRRCFAAGLTAVIVNKGAPEAGAVYVQVTISKDAVKIYAPAPGPTYNEDGDRNWYCPLGDEPVAQEKADDYFQRQRSFDSDIWIMDIDDKSGIGLLDL